MEFQVIMKKAVILTVFLAAASFSFAQEEYEFPNRNLYIEGTAEVSSHRTYFMDNFKMEASALGFNVVDNKADAGYTFKFESQRYDNDFIVLITLTLNEGEVEIVSFGWPYSNLDEMYEYNQFVFFRAVVLIPGIDEDELRTLMGQERIDPRWRNKWIYLRVTFDYPIAFHILKDDGLIGGGAYHKDYDPIDPGSLNPLPVFHQIFPTPGVTVGIEIQPLSFLRLEVNFQVHLGNSIGDNMFLNMAAGAALKVPLKFFKSFDIAPYGAFLYPLTISSEYVELPQFFIGGGVEVDVKMGKSGALVFDVNYMFALTDTIMKNPYGESYLPPAIHYNRFDLGLKVGYKFGIGTRRSKK